MARFHLFFSGEWDQLLQDSESTTQATPPAQAPASSTENRAQRAIHLTRLGELSRARQALLSQPLAPGTQNTLQQLTNPEARPQQPYAPIGPAILQWRPANPVQVPPHLFTTNLRRARRGAPGPSGLTAEIAKVLLDDPAATQAFSQVCCRLAQANIPPIIATALGMGRLVGGGVRGLVVGDFLRRLVARSLAQHFASQFDHECHPHQFALSTRAGAEALVHGLQLTTEADPQLTIWSVDGIGAYDHVSRAAMLTALQATPEANAALPFARLFYSQPSTYLWTDHAGHTHRIHQAEGGEQGDPLMPALFSLALNWALQAFHSSLQPGEHVAAFLDDIYVTAQPARIRQLYNTLAQCLALHTGIRLHAGKTQIWNGAGTEPPNVRDLASTAAVWLGDAHLPPHQQGLKVLGLPVGSMEYIQAELRQLQAKQQPLFEARPGIPDFQTSWLLLLYCASPRVHYALRGVRPDLTRHFATEHDNAVHTCLARLLQQPNNELPRPAIDTARLALQQGGLGLRSAHAHTAAAHWASWQDATPVLRQKMPQVFDTIQQQIENPELPSLQCLQHVTAFLTSLEVDAPPCTQCQPAPPAPTSPHDHADTLRGWQRHASHITDTALKQEHIAHLTAPSQALLESQCGPLAARIFTLFPVSHELVLDSSHFRLLLLRRLRLPLPCQRAADVNSRWTH